MPPRHAPPLSSARAGPIRRPCESFLRMTIARDAVAFRISFFWQLQVMPPQNVVQHRLIDLRIRHELLDPGQILVSANARSDGNDMFGTEYFCRNAFIFDWFCPAHGFFG